MHSGPFDSELPGQTRKNKADAAQPRVLIVSASPERQSALTRSMRHDGLNCTLAQSTDEALHILVPRERHESNVNQNDGFELVIYDLERCSAPAMRFVRELADLDVSTVILCPQVSFDEAVQAMRAGAADIVSGNVRGREVAKRVRTALNQRRAALNQRATMSDDGVPLLEDVDPEAARIASRGKPNGLIAGTIGPRRGGASNSNDMGSAPPMPKAKKIKDSELGPPPTVQEQGAQFAATIRGELDVESLLRHALEFVLAHAGPTNAAVFLPAASGDFSLGAYVNFSCPKDTVEVLLDHLANVAAPKLEQTVGVLSMTDDASIESHVGHGTDWLNGHNALAFCCHHEGECLAVFMIFRERHAPFPSHIRELLGELSRHFGQQLARVVRIHHRHLPKDKWGKLGEPADGFDSNDDHGDLAA